MQSVEYAVLIRSRSFPSNSTGFSTNVRLTPICSFSGTRLNSNVQTAAAVIALLNYVLVSNNKHPLGFLNYWLYEAGLYWDGLNDVTGGSNPGANTDGFTATVGWDPVRPAWPLSLHFGFADSEPNRSPA